jgi:hypothetical protein
MFLELFMSPIFIGTNFAFLFVDDLLRAEPPPSCLYLKDEYWPGMSSGIKLGYFALNYFLTCHIPL